MVMNSPGQAVLVVMLATATLVSCATAQEAAGTGKATLSTTDEPGSERPGLPEAEFVGGTSFRSGSVVQGLWSDLGVEGHYFGGDENNVGYTAGSWTFHGEHWKLAPGFGVAFGDNGFRTMPALSIRWSYEYGWFVSEGLFVQGLLHTDFFPEGTEAEGARLPASQLCHRLPTETMSALAGSA